jgi:hypothetical protein
VSTYICIMLADAMQISVYPVPWLNWVYRIAGV